MKKEASGTRSSGIQWIVRDVVNEYPKTLAKVKVELRRRGLDPGDKDYGLAKVLENGDVKTENGLWDQEDIEDAVIALAELECIEPWIHVCHCFNIPPVEYVKAHRKIAEETVGFLGQDAELSLFFRYEFGYGRSLSEPGVISIKLRDDWQQILRDIREG